MKQTVKYDESDPAREAKAIADIRAYLGDMAFANCERVFRAEPTLTLGDVRVSCAVFLGIEGFPVEAWFRRLTSPEGEAQ
jgi:hypothetical protein